MKCVVINFGNFTGFLNRLLLCSWVCAGLGLDVVAQTPANAESVEVTKKLSLAEAKQIAFQNNWDLLATHSGIDLASAQLLISKEFPNPLFALSTAKVDVSGNGNATPMGNGVWSRSYDSIAAVSQLIEIGGKRADRRASARAGVIGARARFFDARRALNQGVTKAYVAALLAEDNARIQGESARSLRHEADIASIRLKAGDISESDEKQIENNADVFELQAKSAEAARMQARIAVELLLGVSKPMGNWTPVDTLDQVALVSPRVNEAAPNAARPDVFAAEADLRRSQADLKLQKAIRIPDPTFTVEVEHNPPGPPGPDTVGIGVSFPLPLWNRNGGAIKAAKAAQEQSALTLAKIKAQVWSDIANAEIGYREAYDRLLRYQSKIRPKAAKVRESVAIAYEKGGASLVDLLTAERDDNAVRLATAQALADTANAVADLESARNVLSDRELTEQN